MKRWFFLLSIGILILLSSCFIQPAKFSYALKEGRYQYEDSTTEIQKVVLSLSEGSITPYVKLNGRNMVKDLFTIEERFYTVYDVELNVTIEGIQYKVEFESMKNRYIDSKKEYVINGISSELSNLEKIYVELVDTDSDSIAETVELEFLFSDESSKSVICHNTDVFHSITFLDLLGWEYYIGKTKYFENEEIYVSLKKKTQAEPYLILSSGEVVYGTKEEQWIFKFQMPNEDITIDVKEKEASRD